MTEMQASDRHTAGGPREAGTGLAPLLQQDEQHYRTSCVS